MHQLHSSFAGEVCLAVSGTPGHYQLYRFVLTDLHNLVYIIVHKTIQVTTFLSLILLRQHSNDKCSTDVMRALLRSVCHWTASSQTLCRLENVIENDPKQTQYRTIPSVCSLLTMAAYMPNLTLLHQSTV